MTVRWSPEAAADFAAIVEYIRKQNPSAAERVAAKSTKVWPRWHRSRIKDGPEESRVPVSWCSRLFPMLPCTE